jgi:hypothetical protein
LQRPFRHTRHPCGVERFKILRFIISTTGVEATTEGLVREASNKLREAVDSTKCSWCKQQLRELAKVTDAMAEVSPYTDETAKEVRSKTEAELKAVGGKIGVLQNVIRRTKGHSISDGNLTPVRQPSYTQQVNDNDRGSHMDKNRAIQIVGGSLAFGTGLGFVLNRVDEMVSAGQPWYMHVGPAVGVLGGAAIAVLGMTGKIFKGDTLRTMAVAGGSAMMSNAALWYLENLYKPGTVNYPMTRYGRATASRSPGTLPIRVVEETRAY